ncbi:MAG: DUF4384 domain-containing protein [Bryobacterales bacterium]|nr:DUF4384 domain-containing protein [Bryobacterales bacterium]
MKLRLTLALTFVLAVILSAEDLTPRALYYRAQTGSQPAPQPSPQKKASPPSAPSTTNAVNRTRPTPPAPPVVNQTQAAIRPVSHRLGLRYNLLLVDAASGKAQPVSSERTFRSGECVALEIESNEAGYLYILNQGTSGNWQPLLPSSEMPEESNRIAARKTVRVPEQHCFRFDDRPGTEMMFVVLARNAQQVNDLNRAVRTPVEATPAQTPVMTVALNKQVDVLRADLRSRDLKIQRVAEPQAANEPAHAVYVVNTSTGGGGSTPDRVVTEIALKHQ